MLALDGGNGGEHGLDARVGSVGAVGDVHRVTSWERPSRETWPRSTFLTCFTCETRATTSDTAALKAGRRCMTVAALT